MTNKHHNQLHPFFCKSLLLCCFVIAILTGTLILPCPLQAQITLTVGVYENKPLIFTTEDGTPSGLYIDILEHIANQEGWELKYKKNHWEELLEEVQLGKIDLLPAIAYSTERATRISFNDETILVNWAEVYSSKDHSLSSLFDLEGQKVAVKAGDIHFEALKELTEKFNIKCRFIETDGYNTIFEMLDAGYLHIGVVNRLYGKANMNNYKVKITPLIYNPIEMRFATTKGSNRDIIGLIDNRLFTYKNNNDSIYYQTIERWLSSEKQGGLSKYATYITAGTLVVFLVLFGLNLLLRYQVSRQTRNLQESNAHLKKEIAKRRRTMQELKKYARVVEASNDAIALFDREHNHLLVNSTYLKLFRKNRDELQLINLLQVTGQQFYDKYLREPIANCLDGHQMNITAIYSANGQRPRHWHIHLGPYAVSDGFILGYALDIRDITQQVELENQLKHAQKMEAIGMLAGGVAHDLNNILSGLVSYPDMLLIGKDKNDPMYKPLHVIKQSGTRAAAIVSDLLTLARRSVENMEPTNFNTLITELQSSPEYDLLLRSAPGVTVELCLDEELLNIMGSQIHLSKCFMNLFTNAIEAMPHGGKLTISTKNTYIRPHHAPLPDMVEGDYVTLSLTDTGMGMNQETLSHIFEPFYTSKVMGRSGSGLGMTLVWGTVKDHNGHINVQSELNVGTIFNLYFPATCGVVTITSPKDLAEYWGNGESILIIDDVKEQRRFASEILTMIGYTVHAVESGEAALPLIREQEFDALVLDMIMPGGMDGLTTYEKIIAIRPGQRAVIASGFSDTGNVIQAQALGAGSYIRKPYTVLSLAKALKNEITR
jgi:PAS domain S-box-containing protein